MHPYETKLLELAAREPRVVIMTAETRFSMRNIPDMLGDRFIDVGIAEQSLIGIAAGLAQCGKLPICHGLSAFLTMRPFEFIRTDLGYPNLKVVLVGSFNGFGSHANGPTHQAIDDIALMRVIPTMSVVAPRNIRELSRLFDLLDELPGPLYVRYNDCPAVDDEAVTFRWGQNEQLIHGEDVAILSYGMVLDRCVEAVALLADHRIRPSLYNMRFLRPIDAGILNNIMTTYRHIIVIEDHYAHGGLLSIVKEQAADNGCRPRITGVNFGDRFFKPALLDEAMEEAGFGAGGLRETILRQLGDSL